VDPVGILDYYLSGTTTSFIATLNPAQFYGQLDRDSRIVERFEVIKADDGNTYASVESIQSLIPRYEDRFGVIFTYPALQAVAESAARYHYDGVLSDKMRDILDEVIPYARSKNKRIISADEVLGLIEVQTGIPAKEAKSDEKELLLNLEDALHKRVIGQEEAISGISNALRRSRSGVGNKNKPMGSFLFLGPTGVGKTETAKALSSIFFKSESNFVRLDMSEFQGDDALAKLTGAFGVSERGVLIKKIQERPYGVFLLDEFEKTNTAVKDLFLQIFDEGFFSDMQGKKIFVRDYIFIATSNAGSEKIWQMSEKGEDLSNKKDELINSIIGEGVFKPELINRFDGVILFHPLTASNLTKIARLMLENLKKRVYSNGINLEITSELVEYVAATGYDPKFGARTMNRVIQDKIEQYISKGILSGEITKGTTITVPVEALL
jgi:ATP-dependent Clp protease ATP-binding subunit ClpA